GELALEAYDARSAERCALRALRTSPKDVQANRLLTRSYVVLGDPAKAIAAEWRMRIRSSSGCAPATRHAPTSTGASRCWRTTPVIFRRRSSALPISP